MTPAPVSGPIEASRQAGALVLSPCGRSRRFAPGLIEVMFSQEPLHGSVPSRIPDRPSKRALCPEGIFESRLQAESRRRQWAPCMDIWHNGRRVGAVAGEQRNYRDQRATCGWVKGAATASTQPVLACGVQKLKNGGAPCWKCPRQQNLFSGWSNCFAASPLEYLDRRRAG